MGDWGQETGIRLQETGGKGQVTVVGGREDWWQGQGAGSR